VGRDHGERHAASGIGLPGGPFDPVAASGLSGIRSPNEEKAHADRSRDEAPPYQTALGEEREHCATEAGPIAKPPITIRLKTEM
jgi:hypothetical protein